MHSNIKKDFSSDWWTVNTSRAHIRFPAIAFWCFCYHIQSHAMLSAHNLTRKFNLLFIYYILCSVCSVSVYGVLYTEYTFVIMLSERARAHTRFYFTTVFFLFSHSLSSCDSLWLLIVWIVCSCCQLIGFLLNNVKSWFISYFPLFFDVAFNANFFLFFFYSNSSFAL